jgi:membrane-associated phospholipid phosphatase
VVSGGLIIVAKVAFYTCGSHAPLLHMCSPSGHAAFATVFYPSIALAAVSDRRRPVRLAALIAAGGFVATIAASRVALHAHTIAEAVAGSIAGAVGFAWFAHWYGERSTPLRHVAAAVACLQGWRC